METNKPNRTTYLEQLSDSDFELADGQPNITGWAIVDHLGDEVGEVEDLIFDSSAGKIRYIVALIDTYVVPKGGARMVLIPIGVVELHENEDEVILPEASADLLSSLPEYEPDKTISPAEELAIRYAFLGEQSLPHMDAVVYEAHPEDFYNHDHFDDGRIIRG